MALLLPAHSVAEASAREGRAGEHYERDRALAEAGSREEAAEAFREATRDDLDHIGALFNFGTISIIMGRMTEAATAFQEILRIEPENGESHFNMGKIYLLAQLEPLALEEHKTLEAIDPAQARRLFNLIYS